jgi:hypothetical protein
MRWQAVVHYHSDNGLIGVVFDFDEIADLHDLIERGPHWDTIETVSIFREPSRETLTIEQAEKL